MPTIPSSRKAAAAAVNALRALLESHDHIVEEIDQRNDFGEDLYVTFSENRQVAGDVIKVQVKGGVSWRRAGGYGVPVGHHATTWADGNIPVICVVHDPDTAGLYWANATQQLLDARRQRQLLKTVFVREEDLLSEASIDDFVAESRRYASRYRGNQAMRTQLGEMAGVEFEASDIVMHFVNYYGEDLIFWQRRSEGYATLLHSDLDWVPEYVGPEMLRFETFADQPGIGTVPIIGEVILNQAEALWLTACFAATSWAREPAPDKEHANIRAEVADDWVTRQILRRLDVEPDLLARSADVLHASPVPDLARAQEILELEEDEDVAEEAMEASRECWWDMSFEAQRLAVIYLIDRVVIGAPTLPLDEQIKIIWRVPLGDAP
ncbi:DUF4365 domain-containing protein [Micromonospora arborensis]|uniref:DUF4365 domain-containing protein n=1 Tax=Micromonospora arborensis TaxID=2116518 RepID=UPI0033E00A6B